MQQNIMFMKYSEIPFKRAQGCHIKFCIYFSLNYLYFRILEQNNCILNLYPEKKDYF